MKADHQFKEIRAAKEEDCQEMLKIYQPFVENTAVSFEYLVPGLSEFQERFKKISSKYPWLVYTEDERVLGYAYASAYRERKAYQWSVETTVYLDPETCGKGIGRMLYQNLMSQLAERGFFTAYAIITLPNPQSVRFHEKFGFEKLCIFPKAGFKLGLWHDVLWMRYLVSAHLSNPEEPRWPGVSEQ